MSDVSNDYIKKLNDIEIFYKERNIGISKDNPVYKLDVDGPIYSDGVYIKNASITKGLNDELLLTNKGTDNSFSLDKVSSYLITDKLGVNTQSPEQTLDVYGNIKMSGTLHGMNNKQIIDQNADIVLNPNNDFNKMIINGQTMIQSNNNGGGVIIGDSNIETEPGSLVVENNISDIYGNKFLELKDNLNFEINSNPTPKDTNFYGPVNFIDNRHGVKIGNLSEKPSNGELNVENSISVGKKIKINDSPNKILDMSGNNNGNIFLGENTYLGNLNSFGDRKQATILGNNLMAGENNLKVANSSQDGYRGIVMDKYSGINFYTNQKSVNSGDIPDLPSLSISNSGQIIYSMPLLDINQIDIQDITNPIHVYIRKELGSRRTGSMMDFSTVKNITENIFYNSIKITDSTVRTFKIKKNLTGIDIKEIFETTI